MLSEQFVKGDPVLGVPCLRKGDPVMGVPVSDPGGMLSNGARAPSMIQRVQSRRDASRLGLMSMCEKEAIPNWAFLHAIPVGRCELRSRRDANAIPEGCEWR